MQTENERGRECWSGGRWDLWSTRILGMEISWTEKKIMNRAGCQDISDLIITFILACLEILSIGVIHPSEILMSCSFMRCRLSGESDMTVIKAPFDRRSGYSKRHLCCHVCSRRVCLFVLTLFKGLFCRAVWPSPNPRSLFFFSCCLSACS